MATKKVSPKTAERKVRTLAMVKIDALESKKNKTEEEVKILQMLKEKHDIK